VKSYKLIKIYLLLSLLSTTLYTKSIPFENAKGLAVALIKKKTGKSVKAKSKLDKNNPSPNASPHSLNALGVDREYHIVQLEPKGWVIVAADDRVQLLIGYSLESKLDENTSLPPAFIAWMDSINEQIKIAKDTTFEPSSNTSLRKTRSLETSTTSYSVVEPLLTMQWNQTSPYNDLCPMDGDTRSYVGCVATAMSQIMRYHSWPITGEGISSYSHTLGTFSINHANTTYNWINMTDSDKATVSYHAGVSVEMDYSALGSAAYSRDVVRALRDHFRYYTSDLTWRSDMSSDEAWHTRVKDNIDNRLPIYYAGSDPDAGGHAFVLDGYKYGSDGSREYHINWGWGGYADGYFAIDSLTPSTYNFSNEHSAIFDIRPNAMFPTVSNPNPTDGATVAEGMHGQLLRVAVSNATSGKIYYGHTSLHNLNL